MQSFPTYDDLLAHVRGSGLEHRTIGYAPGGRPLLAVAAGGSDTPAACVLTGAHANEHAGVMATVALLDELDTDCRVWIVPTRDPVGLDGFRAALELGAPAATGLQAHGDVVSHLETAGEITHEDPDGRFVLGLIGDYGYASKPLDADGFLLQRLKELGAADPAVLEPYRGRRIYTTVPDPSLDGTEGFSRAYTTVIRPDGLSLHLNRCFEDAWAPPECRAVRELVATIEPGLTIDNHETGGVGDRAYVVCRPDDDPDRNASAERIGRGMAAAMADAGRTLATDEDVLDGPSRDVAHDAQQADDPFYSRAGEGAYWMDYAATTPARGGEGPNAGDFAARHYGLAFDVETGMHDSLEARARATVAAVQAALSTWERNS